MLFSIGVLAMCIGLGVGVIGVVLPRLGHPTPLGVFLRHASVAGALSVGSGVMYVVWYNGGGTAALVAADTTMVLAPATMCVAVWPPSGRRHGSRLALALALVAAGTVGVCTLSLPLEASLTIRAVTLTVVCGACAVLALRNRVLPHRSTRVLGAATGIYGVYSALRIVVVSTAESPLSQSVFSTTGAGMAAVVTMLVCGVAVGLVGRPVVSPGDHGDRQRPTLVAIGDWKLANAAFGADRILGLLLELRLAARDLDPSALDGPHGVEVSFPAAAEVLRERMRTVYGWKAEEIELITDRSAAPPSSWRRLDF